MNQAAERHIAKAEEYLGKGDGWYEKAGREMRAAKDAGATWVEIADRLGRGTTWVKTVVDWAETPANQGRTSVPFARGKTGDPAVSETRRLLREAPLEQVERIIADLPRDRQQAIGAAAGHAYLGARQEAQTRESHRTPAERQEQVAAQARVDDAFGRMTAGLDIGRIVNALGLCTEVLKDMIEAHSITPEGIEAVEQAHQEFLSEYRVARAMAGLDTDMEEVV